MSCRLTEISLEASRHSKLAAESASKGSAAAEDTSRSTRVNIQVHLPTQNFIGLH